LNGEWGISRIDVRFYWSLHGLVLTRRPGMSARLMLLLQPRFGGAFLCWGHPDAAPSR
jgi:hypothetical protein